MKISSQIRIFLAIALVGISQILFAQQCPTITNITSSTAVCAGGNIALEVTATSPDASALTYAWFKNLPEDRLYRKEHRDFEDYKRN